MPIALQGSTSGTVTLVATAVAGTNTLTLPAATGTILQSGTTVTPAQGGTGLSAPGTSGNVLTSNGTIWTSSAPAAIPNALPSVIATYTLASGTSGGTGSSTRTTYPYNTLQTNTLSVTNTGGVLSNLPAGTYYATWTCSCYGGTLASWLRNVTTSTDIAQGANVYVSGVAAMVSNPWYATFTLSGTTSISVEYITPSVAGNRLGIPSSISGASENYGMLTIWKVL